MQPFLTPGGWQESKGVYWKVSVGLKCVRTSRLEFFFNRSPLYKHVSVNVIEGWNLFASSVKLFMPSLFVFHREKISSIYLFQMSGMLGLWLMTSVFNFC